MSDPIELNGIVYVARQAMYLLGVFTTLELAKAACQEHYNRFVTLVNFLEPGILDWHSYIDFAGTPIEQARPDKRANPSAIYQVEPVPVNVNLREFVYGGKGE